MEVDDDAASTGPTPPELREALDSPLPVSGLTMRVFAAPFKGTRAERVGAARRRDERDATCS